MSRPAWLGLTWWVNHFKRKTWKWYSACGGAVVSLGGAAWSLGDVISPNVSAIATGEINEKLVAILVAVLAGLGGLIVVLARVFGQLLRQLSSVLPRQHRRDSDGNGDATEARSDHVSHAAVAAREALDEAQKLKTRFSTLEQTHTQWRGGVDARLDALQQDDSELRHTMIALRTDWASARAEDKAELVQHIDEHHNVAMDFLVTKVHEMEGTVGARVTGYLRDELGRLVKETVSAAVSSALKALEEKRTE